MWIQVDDLLSMDSIGTCDHSHYTTLPELLWERGHLPALVAHFLCGFEMTN